jgi:hypothetical protein
VWPSLVTSATACGVFCACSEKAAVTVLDPGAAGTRERGDSWLSFHRIPQSSRTTLKVVEVVRAEHPQVAALHTHLGDRMKRKSRFVCSECVLRAGVQA